MKPINLEKKQIDLIRESICVYEKCMECRHLFKDGKLSFKSMEEFVDDRGQSCLFRLKEMCHDLFRNSEAASYKEKLYDMTVGYVFHQGMILRENLYQLEYYKPRCDLASDQLTNVEKKIILELEFLVTKAEKKLALGFRETKLLLKELVEQLKDLIRLYKNNYLMPRFVFENEKSLVMIYGKKGFNQLVKDMYQDGREVLLFKAAYSYLESEYYAIARDMFQKVVGLDSSNGKAHFFYLYASAFYFYYKSRFSRAKRYAERGIAAEVEGPEVAQHKGALKKLKDDAARESKLKRMF